MGWPTGWPMQGTLFVPAQYLYKMASPAGDQSLARNYLVYFDLATDRQ